MDDMEGSEGRGCEVWWMWGQGCTCMRSVLAIRGIYLSKALTKEPVHGWLPARLIVTVPSFTVSTATVLQTELVHLIEGISAHRKTRIWSVPHKEGQPLAIISSNCWEGATLQMDNKVHTEAKSALQKRFYIKVCKWKLIEHTVWL